MLRSCGRRQRVGEGTARRWRAQTVLGAVSIQDCVATITVEAPQTLTSFLKFVTSGAEVYTESIMELKTLLHLLSPL
jgi:hypothetical protein